MVRRVVGLDGCPGGWVAVELRDGAVDHVAVVAHVDDVLGDPHDAVGIDIPVGLLDVPVRDADAAARRVLGHRASTVFSTPPRVVADLVAGEAGATHAEASALAVAATGAGISIQAFRLLPRVIEVDRAVAAGADVLEVHPEVAFAHLAGGPLARKTSWAGQQERRHLLTSAGVHLPADFAGAGRCAPDDVLDAAVCALTADLVAGGGDHVTLPLVATQHDDRGRPVLIHAPPPTAAHARADT